jgi:predicted O-methyltransferase YrrM
MTSARAVLKRVFDAGSVTARSDGSVHEVFPVAVSAAEGEKLRSWVIRERAGQTIEVGLGYGISALFILDGLLAGGDPGARHVAVDPNQPTRFADLGLQLVAEAGLADRLELLAEPSELALPRLLSDGRQFELAFVDGNHRFEGVFLDLTYLGRLVRPGGVIFLDDYQLPSVAKAAAFWTNNADWYLEEVSSADPEHGWAVLRTADPPRQRNYDHFIWF